MFTSLPRRETPLSADAWLRRITAALVAVTSGVLAWAAAVPAASAAMIPVPGPGAAYGPVPAAPIRVIAAGGMPHPHRRGRRPGRGHRRGVPGPGAGRRPASATR